ncbi:MAG: AP2/ERF family transcription factor [Acidimicrobiales bacterium]
MARPPRPKRHVGSDGTVTIAGKNPNGSGSTYFHQAKGRWVATYVDPNTGKRRTVTAATKGDAEARRTAKVAELIANRPTSVLGPHPTFDALAAGGSRRPPPASSAPTRCEATNRTCAGSPASWAPCA